MAKPPKNLQHVPSQRLLLVMPTSLADVVMATPTLRAFRQLYPDAKITALVRRHLRPLLQGCPWVDRIVSARQKNKHAPTTKRTGPIKLAARLASAKFDTAVLLPEGLRAALLVRMAGIPRRVGYDRSARSSVLTDRLLRRRLKGKLVPVATREYYLGLARYLGAISPDPAMQLFTRESDDAQVATMLATWGVRNERDQATGRAMRPLVVLVPGAGSEQQKMWPASRFAELADRCATEFGAVVAVSGSPTERSILDQVKKHASKPVIDLTATGIDLTLLKSVIKQSHLVITNDTGPRQMAAAFNVPAVTLFADDERMWSDTGVHHERHVVPASSSDSTASRSSKSKAANSHTALHAISVDDVIAHVADALMQTSAPSAATTDTLGSDANFPHPSQA